MLTCRILPRVVRCKRLVSCAVAFQVRRWQRPTPKRPPALRPRAPRRPRNWSNLHRQSRVQPPRHLLSPVSCPAQLRHRERSHGGRMEPRASGSPTTSTDLNLARRAPHSVRPGRFDGGARRRRRTVPHSPLQNALVFLGHVPVLRSRQRAWRWLPRLARTVLRQLAPPSWKPTRRARSPPRTQTRARD